MSNLKKNENYHIKSTKAKIKNQAIYVSSNQKTPPSKQTQRPERKGGFTLFLKGKWRGLIMQFGKGIASSGPCNNDIFKQSNWCKTWYDEAIWWEGQYRLTFMGKVPFILRTLTLKSSYAENLDDFQEIQMISWTWIQLFYCRPAQPPSETSICMLTVHKYQRFTTISIPR